MGVDILFTERPRQSNKEIGHFKGTKLSHWLLLHIDEADNNIKIPLEKGKLQHLLNDLNRITTTNRHSILAPEFGETNAEYWYGIQKLKTWVKNTLQNFNFEENELMFEIWV